MIGIKSERLRQQLSSSSVLVKVLPWSRVEKEIHRFLKYGLVGTLGTIIDFSLLNFFILAVGWSSDSGKLFANIISTGTAIISNFILNRLWTFPGSRARSKRAQFLQFASVSLIGLILNTAVFYLANRFIYEPFFPDTLAIQLAKATAIGIILFWNFGANRLWTYRGL